VITLKDIAQEVGLSRSTVSDILNERQGVCYGETTIQKVRETAQKMGYQTDPLARALRKGKSYSVGVLVPDLANPFYASFLQRFMARLRAEKYSVLIEECVPVPAPDEEGSVLKNLAIHRVDGLLAFSTRSHQYLRLLQGLQKGGAAVLIMGSGPPQGMGDSLEIDFSQGALRLAKTIYRYGHRHLVVVRDRPWDTSYLSRLDPIFQYYRDKQIQRENIFTLDCDQNPESSYRNFLGLLSNCGEDNRPTCAVVANDFLATGVIRACIDFGLHVPRDISVVSYDNSPQGQMSSCGLTSVGPSIKQIADRASNLMLHRMTAPDQVEGKHLLFTAELFIRDSLTFAHQSAFPKTV